MTQLFEFSVTNRDDAIYTKAELLIDADGTPNHPQPDGPLIDLNELRLADGWMRATAPSGRVAYEGVVAWTPSAGVGIREAEAGQSGSAVAANGPSEADGAPPDDAGVDELIEQLHAIDTAAGEPADEADEDAP
jgi:hypothetical protein